FNDNPQKYIKKADLMLTSDRADPGLNKSSASRVNRFEDAFADDVVESAESPSPAGNAPTRARAATGASGRPPERRDSTDVAKTPRAKASAKQSAAQAAATKQAARAATLLRLGQNLEKSGKTTAALAYFR